MARNRSKQYGRKRAVLAVAAIILILIAGFFIYKQLSASKQSVVDDDGIIYTEATEQEKAESEALKDEIAQQEASNNDQDNSTNTNKNTVTPVITAWGQQASGSEFTLNGYVPSVVETDGTCTLRMNKGGVTVEENKAAFFNAQSTSCGQIQVPYSRLSNGEWTVVLAYASSKSEGVSQELKVEIK